MITFEPRREHLMIKKCEKCADLYILYSLHTRTHRLAKHLLIFFTHQEWKFNPRRGFNFHSWWNIETLTQNRVKYVVLLDFKWLLLKGSSKNDVKNQQSVVYSYNPGQNHWFIYWSVIPRHLRAPQYAYWSFPRLSLVSTPNTFSSHLGTL